MTERITIWITKYALTDGIIKRDDVEIKGDTAWVPVKGMVSFNQSIWRPHWHRTEAEAIARAEEMRVAKIASLEKQIAKLRAMTFGEKGDE